MSVTRVSGKEATFTICSPILCLQVLISRVVDGIIRVAHLQLGSPRIMNVEHVVLNHLFAHPARAFGEVEAPFVESRPDWRTPKTALSRQLDLGLHPFVVDDILQVQLRLPKLFKLKS